MNREELRQSLLLLPSLTRSERRADKSRRDVEWVAEANAWLISAHEALRVVLRNDDRSFRLAHADIAPRDAIALLRGGARSHRLLRGDEHGRLHRWYMRWFVPMEVENYRVQRIVPLIDGIIDRFARFGSAELCTSFCQPVGPRVIASILGLPTAAEDDTFFDRSQAYNDAILAWVNAPQDDALLQKGIRASYDLNEMLIPTIRARRATPQDDLISRMWREGASVMGSWGEEDVLVATREMLLGASGTTREALANALHLLLTDSAVLVRAFATEGALANFVEESLRLRDSRTLVGLPRIADRDVEVAGVTIGNDQLVVLVSDLASTDPTYYPDPETVDLTRRSPKDHFAFGAGAHACVGANLARVQVQEALRALFARLPEIALDPVKKTPERTGVANGFGRSCYGPLHVTF